MFEGETTIKFSKRAAMLMLAQNLSDMFKMPLEVTAMDMTSYSGLEVTFSAPQEELPEGPEESEPQARVQAKEASVEPSEL